MKINRPNAAFLGLIAAYVLICWGIAVYSGLGQDFYPLMYLGSAARFSITFLLGYVLYRLLRAIFLLFRDRPQKPAVFLFEDLKQGPLRLDIYKNALPVFVGFIFFFSAFTSFKSLIADINPFGWDVFFMEADRLLHFGHDPWKLLHHILGSPQATQSINFFYILWFPMFFLVLYWQLFSTKNEPLRMQFFFSFMLTWAINGSFFALFFSSAGPCYYESVTGSGHFLTLMDYLYEVNTQLKVYALDTQEMLWESYLNKDYGLGIGISAFPSVHVATAFLFVLLGYRINRAVFAGFTAFFVLILIGSVHLGWHYAVDGYFAVITTFFIWIFSGWLVRRLS